MKKIYYLFVFFTIFAISCQKSKDDILASSPLAKNLQLKPTDAKVKKHQDILVKIITDFFKKHGAGQYIFINDELEKIGISSMETKRVTVMEHGWLSSFREANELEQRFQNQEDHVSFEDLDRSVYIKCFDVQINQPLIDIRISFKDGFTQRLILNDKNGKIVRSKSAALFSPNWNANSDETLRLMHKRQANKEKDIQEIINQIREKGVEKEIKYFLNIQN